MNGMETQYYLIIVSILGYGIASICYKLANNSLPPIMVSAISTCVYIILLPITFYFVKVDTRLNSSGIFWSVVAALCTCAASLGYFYALKNGGEAGRTTILVALYPGITLLLSMMFLHEHLSIRQGIGIVLALISFFFIR